MEGPVAMEAARSIAGGFRDAAQGAIGLITQDPVTLAEKGIRALTGTSVPEGEETTGRGKAHAEAREEMRKVLTLPEVEENRSTVGAISREIVKWVAGTKGLHMVGALPKLGAAATLGTKMGYEAVEGAVSGFIFTDPHAKNLANLAENVPVVGDIIADFAGQDDKDPEVINRLRGALENAVIGPLVAPLLHAIPAVVKYVKLKNAGKVEEAAEVMAKAEPEIQAAMAKAQTEPVQLGLYTAIEETPSAAPKVAEAGVSGRTLVDSSVYQGQNKGALLQGNEQMIVAKNAEGKDLGYIRVTPEEGGYKVSRIETDPAFRNQGVATQLDVEAQARYGKYLGSTDKTPEGEAFRAKRELVEQTQGNIAMGAVDTAKLIDNIKVSRTMGQDGAAFEFEGVINYAKVTDDNAVKQMITEVVRAAKENIPDITRPTYQSAPETLALAARLGKDPTDLFNSLAAMRIATGDMAAHIKGGDMLIQRMAKDLDIDATRILSGKAELIDLAGFQVKADLLASTMDHVGGLRTEAARATAAGRYKTGLEGVTSANFMKVLEAAGGADYVQKMAERLKMAGADGIPRALTPPKSVFQKAVGIYNYVWVNSVLSGLKTSVVNFLTTGVNTALMPGMRMLGGVVQEAFGAQGGMDQFYQGLYQYRLMRSTLMDSIAMSAKAWRTNGSVLDMSASPIEIASRMDPISELGQSQKAGLNMLGNIVGAPTRFLGAQDEFYKQITYRSHVGAQAWVEGTKQGLEGAALKNFMQEQIAKSVNEQGKGLNEPALLAARAATFTQSLEAASYTSDRAWMAVANSAANQVPVIKNLVLPFVKVPTNLFRQAWDMTPGLNFARKQFKDDVMAGGEAGAMALGKMGLGLALWSAAGYLAYDGRITGGGPRDPDLRRQLGPDWKPYSFVWVNDDGTKSYQSFARFDPFSHFFALAADISEVSGKVPEGEWAEVLNRAGLAMMQNISSKTYLRSIADVMEAFTGDDRGIEKWARSRVASHVPNLVQVFQGDDEVKDMRKWFDGFRSRIPGYADPFNVGYSASAVEAKRDNFGDKVLPPMGYPYNSVNPFAYFRGTDDPVRLELASLTRTKDEPRFALPNPKQGPVDYREIKNPETGQSAYDRWMELHATHKVGGKTLHESMAELIASPSYQAARARMGDGDQGGYKGQSLAVEWIHQRFEMYEKLTEIQLHREFKAMGLPIAQAKTLFEVGKSITRARGSNTATPVSQLQELAGQQ